MEKVSVRSLQTTNRCLLSTIMTSRDYQIGAGKSLVGGCVGIGRCDE